MEIIKSLRWYTGSGYRDINIKLRKKQKLSTTQKLHYDNITRAFENVSSITTTLTLYRGLKLNSEKEYKQFDKGFVSMSSDIDVAIGFADGKTKCCLLHITILPGSKVLDLREISNVPEESEFLLSRKEGSFDLTDTSLYRGRTVLHIVYIPKGTTKFNKDNVDNKLREQKDNVDNKLREQKNYQRLIEQFDEEVVSLMMIDDDDDDDSDINSAIEYESERLGIKLTPDLKQKVFNYIKELSGEEFM
jgi:hypothetical protein